MGGGEVQKAKDRQRQLTLQARTEYNRLNATCRHDITVMARIAAPEIDEDSRRAPVNICAVIDRSGSMKDNIALMKETLQFVVQQLRPEDKLSLITFDHEVTIGLPLQNMTAAGKVQAERSIDQLKERGHTNLSGGLFAGFDQFFKLKPEEVARVESVLLFTDGKANVGVKKTPQLEKATSSVLRQIGRQCSVFTFGFGSEHDAGMLKAIASAGNGLYYYVDNSDAIPESFCDCLGGLLSVAAQNLKLRITAAGDCGLEKPVTAYKTVTVQEHKIYEVTIPDIYSEEEKDILCTVNVPKCPDHVNAQEYQLAVFHLDYFNVIDCAPYLLSATAVITLTPEGPEVHGDVDKEIELQRNRCEAAQALTLATELADQGNYEAARSAIRRCRARIQASTCATDDLSTHLVETLTDAEGGLRDKTSYVEYGKQAATSYTLSHLQQRSNCFTPRHVSAPLATPALLEVGGASRTVTPRVVPELAAPFVAAGPSRAVSVTADEYNPYRKGAKKRMLKKFKEKSNI